MHFIIFMCYVVDRSMAPTPWCLDPSVLISFAMWTHASTCVTPWRSRVWCLKKCSCAHVKVNVCELVESLDSSTVLGCWSFVVKWTKRLVYNATVNFLPHSSVTSNHMTNVMLEARSFVWAKQEQFPAAMSVSRIWLLSMHDSPVHMMQSTAMRVSMIFVLDKKAVCCLCEHSLRYLQGGWSTWSTRSDI